MSADERAEILKIVERFIDAYNNADVDNLMACYTKDVVKLRNSVPAEDYATIKDRLSVFFSKWRGNLVVENHEIVVSGNLAFIRGELHIVMRPVAGGPEESLKKRFIEIWRKEENVWRVARTMDNLAD